MKKQIQKPKRRKNLKGKLTLTPAGNWKCTIRKKVGEKNIEISATRSDPDEAEEAAQEKLIELGLVDYDEELAKSEHYKLVKDSFTEYFKQESATWQESTRSIRTILFEHMIVDPLGDKRIKDLTVRMIDNTIESWRTKYCNDNIKKAYGFLMGYLHELERWKILPFSSNSVKKCPLSVKDAQKARQVRKKKPKIFTEEECRNLLMISRKEGIAYHCCMFVLMLWTGMRGQEVRALRTENVHFDEHYLSIVEATQDIIVDEDDSVVFKDKQKSTKKKQDSDEKNTRKHKVDIKPPKSENSERDIGINEIAEASLRYLIENRPDKSNSLICQNQYGTYISRRSFDRFFDKVLVAAGIEKQGRGPHILRHTFISFAFDQKEHYTPMMGKSRLFVSEYVGHSDLTTTQRIYAHINNAELKKVPRDPKKLLLTAK